MINTMMKDKCVDGNSEFGYKQLHSSETKDYQVQEVDISNERTAQGRSIALEMEHSPTEGMDPITAVKTSNEFVCISTNVVNN